MPVPSSLLELPPRRAVLSLAWPVIVLGLLRSGYFLADAYWAGRLGADAPSALSAIGGAAFATWILSCIGELPAVGTHALAARAAGAGDLRGVRACASQGALLSATLGLLLALFSRPLSAGYFRLLGFSGAGFERPLLLGTSFLEALLLGSVALLLHGLFAAVFRALGDTRTPTAIAGLMLALNAALDPMLMLGAAGIPPMGLSGAAWATVLANGLGAALSALLLSRRLGGLSLQSSSLRALGRVFAIGAPTALSGVGFCLVYVLLGDLLAGFGPSAIAGLGLGHRLESPSFQVCVGFAAAASTLVGQNLGAGRPREARWAAHEAARISFAAMVPFALVFTLLPRMLVALWTEDALTLDRGASYLFVAGAVTVFMALEVVYEGAFAGAGETLPAMVVVLLLTAARLPLAFAVVRHTSLGLGGVWAVIAATTALKGLLLLSAFLLRTRRPGWGA